MAEEGRGMERNDELAAELYRVAALRNYGAAQNNLGIMIAEGRGGLGQDMAESYAWLSLAVENGAKPSARDIVVRRMSEVQLADARAKLVTLRNQLGMSAPQVETAATEVAVAATPAAAPARDAKVDTEIAAARAENAKLIESVRSLEAEKTALQAQLSTRPATPSAAQLPSAGPAAADDPAKLRKELDDTRARLLSITEDNQRLNQEVKLSIIEIGNLRRQMDLLRAQSANSASGKTDETTRKRIVELEASLAEMRASSDRTELQARSQTSEARRETEILKKRLEEATAELARLRDPARQPQLAARSKTDISADQEKLVTENSRLAASARAQSEAVTALRVQLSAAEQALATAREQTTTEKTALQTAIDRLSSENQRLTAAAAIPAPVLLPAPSADTSQLAAEVERLKADLAAAEKSLVDASKQSAVEKSSLQALIDKLTQDNRRTAADATAANEASAAANRQLATLKGESAAAATQLELERSRGERAESRLAEASAQLAAGR